jgi:hypothetical protein
MSTKMFLGDAAYVQDKTMTVSTGRNLNIVDAPVSDQNAANKAYVDSKTKAVQDALNIVTAGAGIDIDTLLDLSILAEKVKSSGTTDLNNAINTEKTRAEAAELVLTNDLATETAAARAAEQTLTADLATETAAARAAEQTLTADLATETAAARAAELRLQTMNILSSTTMLYVPAVYSDSSSLPTPLEKCIYSKAYPVIPASNFDGWRMKNDLVLDPILKTITKKSKFNFYVPATGLKVGDVKAMYLETCTPSVISMPFLTFYTAKKGNGDVGDGTSTWYRSRITYIRNDADVLVAGSKYNMVANLKTIPNIYSSNYFTQHNLIFDNYSSANFANLSDTDDILFFAISSDSSATDGNVECIISKFKIQLAAGIHEFVFSNTHIFADYMKRKQTELWNSWYGTSSSDDPFLADYQIPTRTYS